jgi:hypothetical protein
VTVQSLQGLNIFDYRTDNCNPIQLGFCYEASDVMLAVFLLFQRALLWPLEKPWNPPAVLLLHTNCPSAVPVKSHNYNDSVTSVAGRLRLLLFAQGKFCLKPRGDHLGWAHSDQMVLEMIRRGRLVRSSHSSAEAKVSKPRLKWLSDYYSNEIAAGQPDGRSVCWIKRATLTEYLLKKRELDNSSKLNWTRTKGSPLEKFHL